MLKNSLSEGHQAEDQVALYYQNLGFQLLRRRWRTPFAEIDLLFSFPAEPRHLLLLEVKKRTSPNFRSVAVGPRQKQRLKRAVLWLSEKAYQVEMRLVFVNNEGQIENEFEVFG